MKAILLDTALEFIHYEYMQLAYNKDTLYFKYGYSMWKQQPWRINVSLVKEGMIALVIKLNIHERLKIPSLQIIMTTHSRNLKSW